MTAKTTGEQYTYDIRGNLTAIQGNGIDKEYSYNGNGTRLKEATNGVETFFVTDINRRYEQVVQTYNEDGIVYDTYTYGLQRIDSAGLNNETYLYDGRGSVVGSVDSNSILESYSYTAYGELMPSSPQPTVFGYNAEATDFDTGMQYLRARYYDTGISRFIQEDDYRGRFTRPISMNRYAYTEGNPVMGIDPSGYALSRALQQEILLGRSTPSVVKLPPIVKPSLKQKYGLTDGGSGMTAQDHRLAEALEQRVQDEQASGDDDNPIAQTPDESEDDNETACNELTPYTHPDEYYYQRVNADEITYGDMSYETRSVYYSSLYSYYKMKGLTAAIGEQLPYYNGNVDLLTGLLQQVRGEIGSEIAFLIFSNLTTIVALGLTVAAIIGGIAAVITSGGAALVFMPALIQAVSALTLVTADDYILLFDALKEFVQSKRWKEFREDAKEIKILLKNAKGEQNKAQESYDFYQEGEENYKKLIESIENGTYKKGDERKVWKANPLPGN